MFTQDSSDEDEPLPPWPDDEEYERQENAHKEAASERCLMKKGRAAGYAIQPRVSEDAQRASRVGF